MLRRLLHWLAPPRQPLNTTHECVIQTMPELLAIYNDLRGSAGVFRIMRPEAKHLGIVVEGEITWWPSSLFLFSSGTFMGEVVHEWWKALPRSD